jgi:hypothetical protein
LLWWVEMEVAGRVVEEVVRVVVRAVVREVGVDLES